MSQPTTEPANEDVAYFNQILKAGVDAGCSDVHIKVGTPASYRISRAFRSTDFVPTQVWMQSVIDGICLGELNGGGGLARPARAHGGFELGDGVIRRG